MEERQRAGINIGPDAITVYLDDEAVKLNLVDVMNHAKDGNSLPLMAWVIFWQLTTLNQHMVKISESGAAAAARVQNPEEAVKGIMDQVMAAVKSGGNGTPPQE